MCSTGINVNRSYQNCSEGFKKVPPSPARWPAKCTKGAVQLRRLFPSLHNGNLPKGRQKEARWGKYRKQPEGNTQIITALQEPPGMKHLHKGWQMCQDWGAACVLELRTTARQGVCRHRKYYEAPCEHLNPKQSAKLGVGLLQNTQRTP